MALMSLTHHDGRELDLGGTWREANLFDLISEGCW